MAYIGVIGAAVVGAFGVTIAATSIVAGIVGGAIIGAAIGGISAAITGGSIGKGILFGAIGGAVTGGMGAWASGGGMVTGAATGGLEMGGTAGATGTGTFAAGGKGAAEVTAVSASTQGAGGGFLGMSEGAGQIGASLVTAGGQALTGAFDDSAEMAAKENQANREQSEKLARLQAETQLKIAEMQTGAASGGSASNGDARYTADLQLQNAREQRAQDYQMRKEEYAELEAARKRKAGSLEGMLAGREAGPVDPNAKSIDEQVYENDRNVYTGQQPASPQNINNTQNPTTQQGVMKQEPINA